MSQVLIEFINDVVDEISEEYEKKINLNSDKKRFWLSELKSLNDSSFCDSFAIKIFPEIKNFPKKKSHEEIINSHGEAGLSQYLKSNMREIADTLDIQIVEDKPSP